MKLLKDIGEFALIDRLSRGIKTRGPVIKGIGDDCAALEYSGGDYLLAGSDMIVEDVHFKRSAPPFYIGRKALAAALSDIAAMGGEPIAALISIGLPEGLPLKFLDGIYRGIRALARKYNVNLIGGDTSASSKIVIDAVVLGRVEKNRLALRSGAKKGDIIFVTGGLGGSIKGRHFTFEPKIKEARFLVKNFMVNAMIDISDGLLGDLGHILKQSKAGAVIFEELIPVRKAASGLREALIMGEDYELLFTTPVSQARKIIKMTGGRYREIGEVLDRKRGFTLVTKDCRQIRLKAEGFRHF